MRCLWLLALVLLSLSSQISWADSSCPWINKATALGILDINQRSHGAITSDVSATDCSFRYQGGEGLRTLRVSVEQAEDKKSSVKAPQMTCHSGGTPLPSIGNDAILCDPKKRGRLYEEQIIGGVRDFIFTIQITMPVENNSLSTRTMLEEKVKLAAEQVAGNLF